ncbi:Ornithine decarboxylase [Spiromyces aspiralis]|uniref:Ornithine decarboxylase n=1 Tax=Spiromyces aspiralis TaxID=68401 RepID=A0ACC1HU49_9FUNG|nr:Ornithine decarboxylase [Spiromyces aspiralis]
MPIVSDQMPSVATTALQTPSKNHHYKSVLRHFPQDHVVTAAPEPPIQDIVRMRVAAEDAEDAFFIADLGEIICQFAQWKRLLPRVEPFYAVKCNPDPHVVSTMAELGSGFDCASKAEIRQILDLGISPERIIYAHPCKPLSHLRFAASNNVNLMTFDNADELHKMHRLYPDAHAVLRILTDDSKSLCKLGLKFGASLDVTNHLLETARDLGVNVVGVSFHVGSGCLDENAFADAVARARHVFDQGTKLGFNFTLLDVGGGFPGANERSGVTFDKVVRVLGAALDHYFPDDPDRPLRIIAEPGRYFVASAFSLAVNIIARRAVSVNAAEPPSAFMYYVNDGVYGSFNCTLFDHQVVYPELITRKGEFVMDLQQGSSDNDSSSSSSSSDGDMHNNKVSLHECSIWGPTCDSMDCIVSKTVLPELNVGDWLLFRNMGAYTLCAASQFNGFKKSSIFYTNTFGI